MEPEDFFVVSDLFGEYMQEVTNLDLLSNDVANDELLSVILDDDNQVLVADITDEIVGFSILKILEEKIGPIGLIQGVFVEQAHRQLGIGTRLVEVSEEILKSHGVKYIIAEGITRRGDYFMQKLGYKKVKGKTLVKRVIPPACG